MTTSLGIVPFIRLALDKKNMDCLSKFITDENQQQFCILKTTLIMRCDDQNSNRSILFHMDSQLADQLPSYISRVDSISYGWAHKSSHEISVYTGDYDEKCF